MKSYYLKCNWNGNNLLYIPNNLIFIEEEENDMFDIDYNPDSFVVLRKWNKKEPLFVRNIDYNFLKEIDIPEELLNRFRDACFKKKSLEAHMRALEIFLNAKKIIEE